QTHPAERHRQARVGVPEHREPIEGQRAEPPLPDRHRRPLGETREDGAEEEAIGEIDGADHGRLPGGYMISWVSRSKPSRSIQHAPCTSEPWPRTARVVC